MEKSEVVKKVSTMLSDQEFGYEYERWSRETLGGYYDMGVSDLSRSNPLAFRRVEMIKLKEGAWQDFADVLEIVDIPNQKLPVKRDSSVVIKSMKSRVCKHTSAVGYEVKEYEMQVGGGGFKVTPPVPVGKEVYVSVLVDSPPKDGTIPDNLESYVVSYMMYCALMTDDESESSLTAAKIHLDKYYADIKLQLAINKEREKYAMR